MVVTIIGYGNVGRALCLMLMGLPRSMEINIMDPAKDRSGAFLDLNHGMAAINEKSLTINDPAQLCNSDFIFFTAGVPNEHYGSRLDKLNENKALVHEVFQDQRLLPSAIIIAITNPVDIVTLELIRATKLPWNQVVGIGTYLDSIRFKYHLSELSGVPSSAISALVLGEHGTTQVPILSKSTCYGKPVLGEEVFDQKTIETAAAATKNAAYEIRKTEDGTSIGVSQCAVSVMEMCLTQEPSVVPLSVLLNDEYCAYFGIDQELCISVLVRVSSKGIFIEDLPEFSETELNGLSASVRSLLPYV